MVTPVNPSSAALRNVSCGKCPVSSSSFASGFTSESANSRTLFWSSFCSSVSSRSTVARSHPPKQFFDLCILSRPTGLRESAERLGETLVGSLQVFRVHARFARHRHEVRITDPAPQYLQFHISDHASARGAPQIHSHIHPIC